MNLLLDTQIFIWTFGQSQRLSKTVWQRIYSPEVKRFISIASLWEMQIKAAKGGLGIDVSVEAFVAIQQDLFPYEILPIKPKHIWGLRALPRHHKDPFDRIIIAQAIVEDFQLVSVDGKFANYPVKLIS